MKLKNDPQTKGMDKRTALLSIRGTAIAGLERLLGPHPKTVSLPSSEAVMNEWRNLYRRFALDETDALLVATCTVYGLDLVTVDRGLVTTLIQNQTELADPGYDFNIYYTERPLVASPEATGHEGSNTQPTDN